MRTSARARVGDTSNGRNDPDDLGTGVGGDNGDEDRLHGADIDVVTLSLIASGTARVELTLFERSGTRTGPYPLKA